MLTTHLESWNAEVVGGKVKENGKIRETVISFLHLNQQCHQSFCVVNGIRYMLTVVVEQ